MNALLSTLKVLDFTTLLPGPFATMMLADLGADVVRIESPTRIDFARFMPPFVDSEGKLSYLHSHVNRNKKSISLDLKKKESIPIVERLLQDYDILIEQFRPGVMDRLGLPYERLSEINPRLIYCSLTGYGQSGPHKDRAGHDINYLSLSGIMGYSGKKDTGPALMGIQIADIASGSNNAVIGILAAVISRMKTGKGQYIDVAMTDGLFPYHVLTASKGLWEKEDVSYQTEMLNGGSLYGFYETQDGRYISFGGIEPQFFDPFCRALGLEELIPGSIVQFGSLDEARKKVEKIIKSQPLDYWIKKFKDLDACVEPVLSFVEAINSDYVKTRGLLVEVPGPNKKTVTQLAHPIKFSAYTPEYKHVGCELGRDTTKILHSLGYDNSSIEEMRACGVFGGIEV